MAERCYSIRGEIDLATAPELDADLGAVTGDDADSLAVDFADLTFLDSAGAADCCGRPCWRFAAKTEGFASSTPIASRSTFSKSTAS